MEAKGHMGPDENAVVQVGEEEPWNLKRES